MKNRLFPSLFAFAVLLILLAALSGCRSKGEQQFAGTSYTGFTDVQVAGEISVLNNAVISAPTTIATATPVVVIDSLGVSNIFEVRDAATPVFTVNNGGGVVAAGGQSFSNWAKIAAPTAVTTATPAVVIDSLAAGSALLEIRDAATPVARFSNGGGFMFTGLLTGTAGTSVTVTNGAAFAITAAFQPITASGAVTPTLTIPAAGTYACLYNTSANTILIQDSGNQVLTTAWSAGQYDWLCGYSDGTRFMEVARANN